MFVTNKCEQKQTFKRGVIMNKEEVAMIGFEIVAYSGDARSNYMEALNNVRDEGDIGKTKELIEKGNKSINLAHNSQTKLLAAEASGEDVELGFIFVHGQDHLMTTLLLRDILDHLMNIYEKGEK